MEQSCESSWSLAHAPEGPLAAHIGAYTSLLVEQGFAAYTAHLETRLAADFSRWLKRRRVALPDLTPQHADRYLRHRARRLRPRLGDPSALNRLLNFLRERGAAPRAVTATSPTTPAELLVNDFATYLREDRALAVATIAYYVPFAHQLLTERFGRRDLDLGDLCAADVVGFVQRQARRLPRRAKMMTTALRSFLRYARYRGDINIDLAAAVPAVANWAMTSIPRAVAPEHVRLVLAHCNRDTAVGRRDHAILMLLARLGLRAGEIVALTLEDMDWEAGHLRVCGKGGRECLLPLPTDVGEAIAAYLQQGRPPSDSRRLFLRTHAPIRGLGGTNSLGPIVKRAFVRAGIDSPRNGAHQFRHGFATQMLRQGASLVEIGELLRHRSPAITAIYAKVDLIALRALALPWPGGAR